MPYAPSSSSQRATLVHFIMTVPLHLSSQRPFFVIPVPRHWDPEKFACKQAN
ncbi:MAG: hypothetical protein ACEY3L_17600 [Wolbachia sp.]|uniref:hypothetical protein n=1 Tax=unclassified Wolbachia TaxID=2640676 RepID=UPI002231F021|nr:hypothetical protein [Wolbachia endosymbiont (group A) of Tiphia femorata]